MPQATTATFNTADLKAFFAARLQDAITTESQLGASAAAQLQTVIAQIAPLVQNEFLEMVASNDPSVQQGYLAILGGVVAATTAGTALDALAANRELINRTLTNGLTMAIQAAAGILKIAVLA